MTPIPPTTYNTLPSSHTLSHARTNSDGMISPSPNLSLPPAHKRSPSSDSGNAGSRSNTPVSYHMGKIHTAFLHGNYILSFVLACCDFHILRVPISYCKSLCNDTVSQVLLRFFCFTFIYVLNQLSHWNSMKNLSSNNAKMTAIFHMLA